eukprot:tig00000455_g1056.t1
MVIAKLVERAPGATTVRLFGLHSGLQVVSYAITNGLGATVTKTPSSSTANVLVETVDGLSGITQSDGALQSGVTISLTFRTADGTAIRDTTISGPLTAVPGTFASYAVLSGSSDAGCLPPSLATLLWTAASTEPLAASAQATLTVSNASVVASSVLGYNMSKGASGAATRVFSRTVVSPASFFDSTRFYLKAVSGSFVRPDATDFPTTAPPAPTCASQPASVSVVLPLSLAECQDPATRAALVAAAASTAGVDTSAVTVECATVRRTLQASSTKVTYVFAASSTVPAGAVAQSFLQQISCDACITVFSNNLATSLVAEGSSLTVNINSDTLKLVTPSGAIVDPVPTDSDEPSVVSVAPSIYTVAYHPPDNFTVTPPILTVTVANLALDATANLRCAFRDLGNADAATVETAATVVSVSQLQCSAPAHPRFLPQLWNVTYRADVVSATLALPALTAPNAKTFTWAVVAPGRVVSTFAPASSTARYGQTSIRVLLAAQRANVDVTASGLASAILRLSLSPVVASNPSLTPTLLASMISVSSSATGSTPGETLLTINFQHALVPQASIIPARAVAWAVAAELARPWARFGGAEVLAVGLASPVSYPISIKLVSFIATEDLEGETPEARLTRSLVNAREEVLFPGGALPEPTYPSVSVVGSAMADDVRVEVYDTLQTTAHAFAQALRDYALCDGNIVDMAFVMINSSTVDTPAKAPALKECATAGTNPLLRLKGMPYGRTFVHVALSTDFRKSFGSKSAEERQSMRTQALSEAVERVATARSGVSKHIAEESIRDSEFALGTTGTVLMFTLGPIVTRPSRIPASYVASQLLQTRASVPKILGFTISTITISDTVPLDVVLTFGGAPPAASAIETALRAALCAQFAEFAVSRNTVFLRHLSTAAIAVTLRLLDYDALTATAMAQHILDLYVCRGSPLEGAAVTALAVAPTVPATPELNKCVQAFAALPPSSAVVYTREPGFSVAPPTISIIGEGFPEPVAGFEQEWAGVACRFEPLGATAAASAAAVMQTPATIVNSTRALCAVPPAPAFVASLWPVSYRVGLKVPSRPLDAYARSLATFTWELSVPPLPVTSVPATGLAYGQSTVSVKLAGAALSAADVVSTELASEIRAIMSTTASAFSSLSYSGLVAMVSGAVSNGSLAVTFAHEASTSAAVVPSHTFARAFAAALAAPWSALYGRPVVALAISQPVPYPAAVYSVGFAGASSAALRAALDAARAALHPADAAIPGSPLSAVTGTTLDGRVALYDGVAVTGMAFAASVQQHAVCDGNALGGGGVIVLGVAGTPAFPRCPAAPAAAAVAGIADGSALALVTMDADFAAFVGGLAASELAALRDRAADDGIAAVAVAQNFDAAAVRASLKDVAFAPGSVVAAFAFGPVDGAPAPAASLARTLAVAVGSPPSGGSSFLGQAVTLTSYVAADSSTVTHVNAKATLGSSSQAAAPASPALTPAPATGQPVSAPAIAAVAACAAVGLLAIGAALYVVRRHRSAREHAMQATASRGRSASLALNIHLEADAVTHVEVLASDGERASENVDLPPQARVAWTPPPPPHRSHRSKSVELPTNAHAHAQAHGSGSDDDAPFGDAGGARKARRPSSLVLA